MEQLLGISEGLQRAKRGPKSQLQPLLKAGATLPRHQQQNILALRRSHDRPSDREVNDKLGH